MARPKLPDSLKKVKFNLTLSREAKEQLEKIGKARQMPVSAFVEEAVAKEYKRLLRNGSIAKDTIAMPGQIDIEEVTDASNNE